MRNRKPQQPRPPGDPQPCPDLSAESGHAAPAGTAAEPTPGLTPQQDKAIEAILQQPTLARAAMAVGVHERTLRRWLTEPLFGEAVRAARRVAYGHAIGLVQFYASVAVAALVKVVNDPAAPTNCRVTAAAVLLKFGREGIELDDLVGRVEALERSLAMPEALPAPDPQGREESEEEPP